MSHRERLVRQISAAVMAGLTVGALSAQITPPFACVASAGVPPLVRASGAAELMGDLVLSCTGGTPTPLGAPVPKYDIRVFLNVGVTNGLLSGIWTDALLLIDEPPGPDQKICHGCTILGVGAEPGVDYRNEPNVYQGRLFSVNGLEFPGVPIDPPGTQAVRVIRVTNVRGNASVAPEPIPDIGKIDMFVSAIGSPVIPIQNPQQAAAFTQEELNLAVPSPGAAPACAAGVFQANVRTTERFATVLKRRSVAVTSPLNPDISPPPEDQNTPGALSLTETGFFNSSLPDIPGRGDLGAAGLADFGTRVLIRVNNVPQGVLLFTATTVWLTDSQGQPTGGALRLIASGRGEFSPKGSSAWGFANVPVIAKTGWAVFEAMDASPVHIEEAVIPMYVAYSALSQPGTASVSAQPVPLTAVPLPSASEPIPRFLGAAVGPETLFTIEPCPPQ